MLVTCMPVGTSLVGDWQSTFVIPRYIADAHPDLKTPHDLKKPEYQDLFSTPDSGGKARLVGCVPDWSCALVNIDQIEGYDLLDDLHLVSPGSQEALYAEIYSAYEKQQPWLGYMWGTGDPALKLDLVRLRGGALQRGVLGHHQGLRLRRLPGPGGGPQEPASPRP